MAIQVQRRYCRSTYGRTPGNHDKVFAPGKVPLSTLTARIEERYSAPRL